jgi:uncharacterized protein (DUF58 family)
LSILIAILALALVAVVVLVVSAPLRASRRPPDSASAGRGAEAEVRETGGEGAAAGVSPPAQAAKRGDLEAAREAKYREIRDAELDYRTGKLSREDYEAIDGELRAEAIEILNRLEADEG